MSRKKDRIYQLRILEKRSIPCYNKTNVTETAIRFDLEWKNFSQNVNNTPIKKPKPKDKITSNNGSKIIFNGSTAPELIDLATPNEKAEVALYFVLDMAKQLGMKVVAKGVESAEDMERMKKRAVNYMQGYYIAEPLSAEDFLNLLKK